MTGRYRRVAGRPATRALSVVRDVADREAAERALRNYIALAPFSGDAWLRLPRAQPARVIPGTPTPPAARPVSEVPLYARIPGPRRPYYVPEEVARRVQPYQRPSQRGHL